MSLWVCAGCASEFPARERVGRRDTCPHCEIDLHSCKQCSFYEPGSYNDCREPQAERVVDKERANFCDYFAFASRGPRAAGARSAGDARSQLESLFRKK